MAFAGGLGLQMNLNKVPLGESIDRDDYIFFSESNTRFLVEIAPQSKEQFEDMMSGIALAEIGQVTDGDKLVVYGRNGKTLLNAAIAELKEAWQQPLRW